VHHFHVANSETRAEQRKKLFKPDKIKSLQRKVGLVEKYKSHVLRKVKSSWGALKIDWDLADAKLKKA
jgi:hypothetical protein